VLSRCAKASGRAIRCLASEDGVRGAWLRMAWQNYMLSGNRTRRWWWVEGTRDEHVISNGQGAI
jgi:hypothetical protein